MFVALRVKDAICDRFRSRAGRRPDVSVQSPDLRIHVQLYNRPESSGAAGAAGGRGGRSVPRMVLSLDSARIRRCTSVAIASPRWKRR